MSEQVERRLLELLDDPTESPYGNPIPGLDELGGESGEDFMEGVEPLSGVPMAGAEDKVLVRVRRITEELQKDEVLMSTLRRIGALPDRTVAVSPTEHGFLVGSGGESAEIDAAAADDIFVRRL